MQPKNQLIIKNVKTIDGHLIEHVIPSATNQSMDAEGKLTILPALIDPHVHFSTTDTSWINGTKSAIAGGITTVLNQFDHPPCCTKDQMDNLTHQIDEKLAASKIPLRYRLYLNADDSFLDEISKAKNSLASIAVTIDSKNLSQETKKALGRLFNRAALENVIVAPYAASDSLKMAHLALELTEKYGNELVLSVKTQHEMDLVKQAKKRGLLVHAEAAFHQETDLEALWKEIHEDTIDFISSGDVSSRALEWTLPALLTAFQEKKISLEKIVHLTRINPERIFRLAPQTDMVLVDLEKTKKGEDKKSPFFDKILKGWPVYTILKGQVFRI